MPLTIEQKVEALLRLPWTVRIERSEEGYFVARCAELQGSIATGREDEIEREFWASMRATLSCVLEDGDAAVPLPKGVSTLPWAIRIPPRLFAERVRSLDISTESAGAISDGAVAA